VPLHQVTNVAGIAITPAQDSTVLAGNAILSAILAATGGAQTPGSTGHDYSANRPTLPTIGSNWPNSGPYANWFLVATIPVTSNRVAATVVNTSGTGCAIMRDDGTAAASSPPVQGSVFTLLPNSTWTSPYFKGRVQVFAPSSGAIIAAFAD
jgi:hypothetical protein